MGTLVEKLAYLNETKEQLKALLIEAGQTVDDTTSFRSYVELCRTAIGEGGGSSELVGYVTFMNGDVELYKMPFIKNFDCPDPITEGLIETPTKESTQSTIYTYSGWDNDLSDLTEDVIVNATYEESTRYYTITFYDEDGTTVLNTMQVAYGETPSYTPSKTGYTFKGWTTELAPVTGDTSYIASWQAAVYFFASSSWTDIAAVSEAGQAQEHFAIGDTREETIIIDGSSYAVRYKIIGFDHDEKVDGTGKAGMTIAFFRYPIQISPAAHKVMTSTDMSSQSYGGSVYKTYVDGLKNYLSADLQEVILPVYKPVSFKNNTTHSNIECELFPLSVYEAGANNAPEFSTQFASSSYTDRLVGTCYEFFNATNFYGYSSSENTRVSVSANDTNYSVFNFIFRDTSGQSVSGIHYPYYDSKNNKIYNGLSSVNYQTYIPPLAFCV